MSDLENLENHQHVMLEYCQLELIENRIVLGRVEEGKLHRGREVSRSNRDTYHTSKS